MRNYCGLYQSTYTEQLPFGTAIVRGAYDEGYDWAYTTIWRKGFDEHPARFRQVWCDGQDGMEMTPMNRIELEDYIKARDWEHPVPSDETLAFKNALERGTSRPYDIHGREDKLGLFDTNNLALDIWMALWDGIYDGYIKACYECADKLGIKVKEREE